MNPQSPVFQGNFQLIWNSTSLDALKKCPRQYQYAILQGWATGGENIDIVFGLTYHKAVELYHFARAKGADHEEALLVAVRHAMRHTWPDILIDKVKNRPALIRSIIWYLDEFGIDDPMETVILSNGEPAVEVTFLVDLDIPGPFGESYLLGGHLDRLVNYNGARYFTDLKTTKQSLGEFYFDQFSPHNQMSCYNFSGRIHSDEAVRGGIIDAASILVSGTRFQRGPVNRTPDTLNEWHNDLGFWLKTAEQFAKANYWPMNDTSCYLCRFRKYCAMDPKVRDSFIASNFVKRIVNPLEVRT